MIRLATDVGGTFTDLLGYDDESGQIYSAKTLTTVDDQSRGVLNAISAAKSSTGLRPDKVEFFVHGGTTVINAITERKGVKTAVVTTKGFRDVLEIGRGNRPDLYNLKYHSPPPYVERHLRFEIAERIGPDGTVIEELKVDDVNDVADRLAAEGVDAVAILFLHSYANPRHESRCAELLARKLPTAAICCSHGISRLWREYERLNTVVLNAYVKPIIAKYFQNLETALIAEAIKRPHYAMLSNGGVASFRQASETPLNLVESGPSGGIAGAVRIGEIVGERNVLALDVGGTTAKCSVIVDGKPRVFSEHKMGWSRLSPGYSVQVPVVDIVEIGAGGGSIANVDGFGTLVVGPESAGASPGPVCYGLGGARPTVTDAKLVTGVVDPRTFAGGKIKLDVEAARRAIGALGARIGLPIEEAAQAIVDVAEANMINALKLVTIQRGYDPRDFSLVISGGAGPMFAASLGRELKVKRVVVPPHAGIFSAWGMLAAHPRVDLRKTWFRGLAGDALASLADAIDELRREAVDYFGLESRDAIEVQVALQLRYHGQEHSVNTAIDAGMPLAAIKQAFHVAHKRAYSFSLPDAPIEVTGIHLAGELPSRIISCPLVAREGLSLEGAASHRRPIYFGSDIGWVECPVLDRDRIPVGVGVDGPLLIEEPTTTTLVLHGQQIVRGERGIIVVQEKSGE